MEENIWCVMENNWILDELLLAAAAAAVEYNEFNESV